MSAPVEGKTARELVAEVEADYLSRRLVSGPVTTLRGELLSRTSEILAGLWVLALVVMLLVAHWSAREMAHARCIEALKDPGVGDVVRMSICTR